MEPAYSCNGTGGLHGKTIIHTGSGGLLGRRAFSSAARQYYPPPASGQRYPRGHQKPISRSAKLVLAVTLHNIPEGMAVGVVYAALLSGGTDITVTGALALSLGIAIQNFPEGAIISMPLHSRGTGKMKSFIGGALSGIVEPLGAVITILAASFVTPILPYLLSFAAGAMIYVVVEELIPEMSIGKHSNTGTLCFALGFTLMLALDVALG